jgi:hypothetical protein
MKMAPDSTNHQIVIPNPKRSSCQAGSPGRQSSGAVEPTWLQPPKRRVPATASDPQSFSASRHWAMQRSRSWVAWGVPAGGSDTIDFSSNRPVKGQKWLCKGHVATQTDYKSRWLTSKARLQTAFIVAGRANSSTWVICPCIGMFWSHKRLKHVESQPVERPNIWNHHLHWAV